MRPAGQRGDEAFGGSVRGRRAVSRAVLGAAGTVVVILGLVVVVPLVLVEIDESAVPSADQVDLPDGVVVDESSVWCASGGCWLEVHLDTSDQPEAVLDELRAMDGTCPAVGGLDRRRVCIDSLGGGVTSFALSYKKTLGL